MKYYNEAKSERIIRRKAMFLTFALSFIFVSIAFFTLTESGRDVLPDQVKEWFNPEEVPEKPVDSDKKVDKKRA